MLTSLNLLSSDMFLCGFPHTPNSRYSPTANFNPNNDYSGPNSMCGHNAIKPLFPVKTLKIEAGSTIGFGAMHVDYDGQTEDRGTGEVSRYLHQTLPLF